MRIKTIIVCVLLPFLVFISKSSFASVPGTDHSTLMQEVYIKSGLAKQVPAMQAQVKMGFEASGAQLPPQAKALFVNEINKYFEPVVFEQRVKQNIESSIDDQTMLHMLKWYNSPLGKKITKLEEQSSTPEETEKTINFVEKNINKRFPEKLFTLIEQLDQTTHATDMATDVGIYLGASIVSTLNDFNPNAPSYSKEQLLQYVESQRSQIRASAERQILLTLLFTYRKLTLDELAKYVEFMGQKTSRTFNDAVMKALLRSIYIKGELI